MTRTDPFRRPAPMALVALVAILVVVVAATALSPTVLGAAHTARLQQTPKEVGGTIVTNTTWTAAEGPYLASQAVRVGEGVSLVIEPGVRVAFSERASLEVDGTLLINGAQPSDVVFTSNKADKVRGDWPGVLVSPRGRATIRGLTVQYAGRVSDAAIEIVTSTVTLENVLVEETDANGIYVDGVSTALRDVTIRHSARAGISVRQPRSGKSTIELTRATILDSGEDAVSSSGNVQWVLSGTTARGNKTNGILIRNGTIDQDISWTGGDLPYVLDGTLGVRGALSIAANTVVKMTDLGNLRVQQTGTLAVNGAAGSAVFFTAVSDDTACTSSSVDCDTNNDSNATVPTRGSWGGLIIEGSGSAGVIVKHAEVRYSKGPAIDVKAAGVQLENVKVSATLRDGIAVRAVPASIVDCEISDSRNPGLTAAAGVALETTDDKPVAVVLRGNRFRDNDIAVLVRNPNINLTNEGNSTPGYTNGRNGYQISGGNMIHTRTWRTGDLPFIVDGRVLLRETVTLTLEAGLTVKFETRASIETERGRLRIGAPSGEKVLLTSIRDDACSATQDSGCDTNGNGVQDQPSPGDWGGLVIRGSSAGAFMYSTVMRFGGDTLSRTMFDLQHPNSVVRDCAFSESSASGLRVYQTSTTLANNLVADNRGDGMTLVGGSVSIVVTLNSNTIRNNGGNAIDADANVELLVDANNVVQDNFRNGIVMHGDARVTHTWRRTADDPARAIPYILLDDVVVTGKSTLTIEPGTVIKLFEAASISATDGRLLADGTADRPIVFTSLRDDRYGGNADPKDGASSPNAGDWKGLVLSTSGRGGSITHAMLLFPGEAGSAAIKVENAGTTQEPSRVSHVLIRDGSGSGVTVEDAGIEVTDVTIEGMRGNCIELRARTKPFEPVVTGNTLKSCAAALVMDANVQPTLAGNTATGNRLNGAQVEGTMTLTRVWTDGDLPYVVSDRLVLGRGANLQIEAGTVVKALINSYIQVERGALEVPKAGSGDAPIFFTSIRDDRCTIAGGTCDTNGDESLTSARPGDWEGIVISDLARDASISAAHIAYAGARSAAILVEKNNVDILNSTITASGTDGVVINNVAATVRGNLFTDNTLAGLNLKSSNPISVLVEGNVFTGNGRSIIHRAKGNVQTRDNVAIGNVNDAMLYCAEVTTDQTWLPDIARDIECTFRVANSVLTLDPGLVLRFASGLQINVEKELRAEGVTFSATSADAAPGFWRGLNYSATSTGGYVRHSWMLYAGSDSVGAVNMQSSSGRLDVLFNKFLRIKGLGVSASQAAKVGVIGNIIRDVRGPNAAGVRSEGQGTNPDILYNRIAETNTGVVVARSSQPTLRMNNLAATTTGVNNNDFTVCVPAPQNWWGDVNGPTDKSQGRNDACKLTDNPNGKGVTASDHVNYLNWLKAPPPDAPAVFGPRCGVTSNRRPTVFGATSPGATVEIYDSLSQTPDQAIATITADAAGSFSTEVDLSRGEHRLSLQAVLDARRSPVSGFRVISVRDDVPVDPAGIRFEYGSGGTFRVQPLRDVAGCSVACGGASSGRVTLPPDTAVRVRVPVSGSPSSVEFVQEGQPARPMLYDGAGRTYVTDPIDPVQGPFTIRVDGASATRCEGFIFIGDQNVVFMDTGASGGPAEAPSGDAFDYDFEHGYEGWSGSSPWAVSDEESHSKSHAWSDSPGGNYLPSQELELRAPGPIDMRTVTAPVLMFYHMFSFARGDMGLIQIRRGETGSWEPLPTADFRSSSSGWRGEVISLDNWAREPRLYLRFLLRSDSQEHADGWHIDDVRIVPGGMLNGRYDAGEPHVAEAQVTLEWQNLDSGQWLPWDGTPTGQLNPQSTDAMGRYGFYYLEPGIYRTVLNLRGKAMLQSEPLVVWNGALRYDAPMTLGQPIYLPAVLDSAGFRRR